MSLERDADGFLFPLGATVTHAGFLENAPRRHWPALFITERSIQQCPGGIQRHYVCRLLGDGTFDLTGGLGKIGGTASFNEIELAPLPPAPAPAKKTEAEEAGS